MKKKNRLRRWIARLGAYVAARLLRLTSAPAADSVLDVKADVPLDRGRAGLTWQRPRKSKVTEGGNWGVFAWEDPDLKN